MGYEVIEERLEKIGMTTRFLSIRTKIPEREVIQMMKGLLEINNERAYLLSEALNLNFSDIIHPPEEDLVEPALYLEKPDHEDYDNMVRYISLRHGATWEDVLEHKTDREDKKKIRKNGKSVRGAALKARLEIYEYLSSLGWASRAIGEYCNRDGSSIRNYLLKIRGRQK